jgi:HAD superfamily hydrolase (TIGR01662 family)
MASNVSPLKAVLFDRDGTLVVDVPYNGDPAEVRPFPGARRVLDELRSLGLATGVLSNQSGIARGILTRRQVESVNARVEDLLGPFDVWEVCPHADEDGCRCRKPAPGMIHSACSRLGIDASEVAFIGDIGSDVEAARAAGARGVLVPTPLTRNEEVAAALEVAADLEQAVALLLRGQA